MSRADALAHWLRLTLAPGIGGATQRRLLSAFGLPETIFSSSRADLEHVIGGRNARLLLDNDADEAIERALRWDELPDQQILTLADSEYPRTLLEIPDPPTVLYVRGRCELLAMPALAIVGSRSPTPQGELNAERFAATLAQAGLSIVSGLALGVDAAAHRGALSVDGGTVAVVGTGIDRIYPARNKDLALKIGEAGAILSEFCLGTPVAAANFPRRNRLISGLARGVLVVEAAVESGSLITSRLAAEQGREVFAIPGSIHSPQSRGCHKLIKQGAKLVETAQDILEELRWDGAANSTRREARLSPSPLLTLIGYEPFALDDLVERTGQGVAALSAQLLELELNGEIACLPGGLYQRLDRLSPD